MESEPRLQLFSQKNLNKHVVPFQNWQTLSVLNILIVLHAS